MSKMMNITNQTPIEIALGIDENGMTTARKLFEFLGFNPSNYSKWCKRNITDNEFATEGEDFYSSPSTSEGRGNFAADFKLSASFAKKLSMMSKSERGEEARKYFIAVEKKMKDSAAQIQGLSRELRAVIVVDQRVTKVQEETHALRQDFEVFKQDMPILGVEETRITEAVKRKGVECLGGKESPSYHNKGLRSRVYQDIYRELKRQFGVATYKAIKRNQTNEAVKVIDSYHLPLVLKNQVDALNAQTGMWKVIG